MMPKIMSGGEFNPKFIFEGQAKNLKEKTVYLISTEGPFQNPQDRAMRNCITIRAAKENGAEKVILVALDLSYSRQDRSVDEDPKMLGEANTAKLYAELLKTAGVDEVITIHLHNKRVTKYHNDLSENNKKRIFNIQPTSLYAHYLLTKSSLIIKNKGENIVFISPDAGAKAFVEKVREQMFLPNSSILLLNKLRKEPNHPDKVIIDNPELIGTETLDGKIGIIFDDIIDTGGTFLKTTNWLFNDTNHDLGKLEGLFANFTHSVMGGKSYQDVQKKISENKHITEIVLIATRPFIINKRETQFKKNSTVIEIPMFIADVIKRHNTGENIEESYIFKNTKEMSETMNSLYKIS